MKTFKSSLILRGQRQPTNTTETVDGHKILGTNIDNNTTNKRNLYSLEALVLHSLIFATVVSLEKG